MRFIRRRHRDGCCKFVGSLNPYYVTICKNDNNGIILGRTITEKQYKAIIKIIKDEK